MFPSDGSHRLCRHMQTHGSQLPCKSVLTLTGIHPRPGIMKMFHFVSQLQPTSGGCRQSHVMKNASAWGWRLVSTSRARYRLCVQGQHARITGMAEVDGDKPLPRLWPTGPVVCGQGCVCVRVGGRTTALAEPHGIEKQQSHTNK